MKLTNIQFNEIVQGFMECAMWAEEKEGLEYSFDAEIVARDIVRHFIASVSQETLNNWIEWFGTHSTGHDLWLTMKGHGAGFWDRDCPNQEGDYLTECVDGLVKYDIIEGDDGLLYFE